MDISESVDVEMSVRSCADVGELDSGVCWKWREVIVSV